MPITVIGGPYTVTVGSPAGYPGGTGQAMAMAVPGTGTGSVASGFNFGVEINAEEITSALSTLSTALEIQVAKLNNSMRMVDRARTELNDALTAFQAATTQAERDAATQRMDAALRHIDEAKLLCSLNCTSYCLDRDAFKGAGQYHDRYYEERHSYTPRPVPDKVTLPPEYWPSF